MDFTSWDAGLHTTDNDYLAHYGVLGMKWGIHRAAKKGTTYTYKSHATKKYERKAAKALKKGNAAKAAKMANRAKRSREVDRGEEEFARKINTGTAMGLTMFGQGDRLKAYAQNRAMYGQKGINPSPKKVLAGLKAVSQGTLGSRTHKAAYIRQDEGKKGLGQYVFKKDNQLANDVEKKYGNYFYGNARKRRR